jgi:hypothetical protein
MKYPVYSETSYSVFARVCLGVETVSERRGKFSPSALTQVRKLRRASCYTCPITATVAAGNAAIDAVIEHSGKVMLRFGPQIMCLYTCACARASLFTPLGDARERIFDTQNFTVYPYGCSPEISCCKNTFFHKMTILSQTTRCHNTEDHKYYFSFRGVHICGRCRIVFCCLMTNIKNVNLQDIPKRSFCNSDSHHSSYSIFLNHLIMDAI